MGRVKPGKPHRRTWEQRVESRENRSSAAYLRRIQAEVEAEKSAKADPKTAK